jgi:glycosyltransferase involved in cell wall biosynthesis
MSRAPLHVLVNAINDNAVPRGPDRYLLELLPRLCAVDADLRFTLAHAPWQTALADAEVGPRVQKLALAAPRRPAARLIWQALRFPLIANQLGVQLTFLPNLIWTPGLRGPTVMTAHDLLHFRYPEKFGRLKAALLRRVIRLALRRSDAMIAVSEFTAKDVTRFGGVMEARITTIPEGGPPSSQRSEGATQDFFLFVGKLERTKGITDLIRAFQQSEVLAKAGYRLVIIGPDGNASEEVATALRGDEARISRPGFVSDSCLHELYGTCRGFVFPSIAEGFGLVVLEAMAHGAPVIAANATSLPEVIGKAGLLVPPNDVEALRLAMERLARDDALFARLQEAGYARLQCFSWEEAAEATAKLFRKVAS